MGKYAKTIKNLLTPFKLGLGGTIGYGKQPFPFIHEKDVINAFFWAVEDLKKDATFNLVAPESITNNDFIKTFAKKINRPAFVPVPEFAIKMILGEAASLLLKIRSLNQKYYWKLVLVMNILLLIWSLRKFWHKKTFR